jgi:hypothetical protein
MNDQAYGPVLACLLGVGLFWAVTTPLAGALFYPRRLGLPPWMRWISTPTPEVMGPYHRNYIIVGSLILEAFPVSLWVLAYAHYETTGSPMLLPSVPIR